MGPWPRSHSHLHRSLCQGGASWTPSTPRVVSQRGVFPGIQGAGNTTLPNQSPCGGGATSLWAYLEQLRMQTGVPEKGSSERVDLWSSWLRECVLCAGVGVRNRRHHGWEAGFWKGVGREFLMETQVSFFFPCKSLLPSLRQLALCTRPRNSRAPAQQSFCGMGCRHSRVSRAPQEERE